MNTPVKSIKLLLVEDSPEDVFFFKRALSRTKANVNLTVATDGRAALDILGSPQRRPDIVFLDLKLPLVHGFDVLRWVLEQKFVPPLHIVVLSGSPHEKDRSLAAELGAVGYHVKPLTVESLQEMLSSPVTSDKKSH